MRFELEPHNRNVPESELVADLERVANELQKNSVSRSEYDTRGRFHSDTLSKRFGSWSKAVEKAGLAKSPNNIKKISDEKLLDDLRLVAKQIQKSGVTRDEYNERSQFASANFRKRLPEQMQHDKKRSAYLKEQDIEELRFWNHQWHANREGCLLAIWDALQRRTGCVRVMKNTAEQRFVPPDVSKIKFAEKTLNPSP